MEQIVAIIVEPLCPVVANSYHFSLFYMKE